MSNQSDPIADFLTRLRNANSAKLQVTTVPYSKIKAEIARLLKQEGYIGDYSVKAEGNKKFITVALKYFEGRPVIDRIDRISKPSLRIYKGKDELPKVLGGLGIAIISTPSGVVSDRQARAAGHGGEIICLVA